MRLPQTLWLQQGQTLLLAKRMNFAVHYAGKSSTEELYVVAGATCVALLSSVLPWSQVTASFAELADLLHVEQSPRADKLVILHAAIHEIKVSFLHRNLPHRFLHPTTVCAASPH